MTFEGIDGKMDIEKLRAKARELAIRNLSIEGENEILLAEVTRLTKLLAEAKDKGVQLALGLQIKRLNEQIAARNRELFGLSRTERRKREEDKPEETSKPKRPGHGPNKQEKLPRIEEHHTLDEPDMVCPNCEPAVPLKEWEGQTENTVQVTLVERKIKLVEHKCQKYKCPICGHIDTAFGPKPLVPGGRYAPEFGVAVAVDKYSEHLPLERQVLRFERLGLQVTSATLCDQLAGLYQLLLPSYLALQDRLLTLPVLGADESPWRVMGKGRSARRWVWALVGPDAVFYQLAPTRGTAAARGLLKNYAGVLMADGCSVYKSLEAAGQEPTQAQLVDLDGAELPTPRYTLVTCWMHARRGLIHAEKNHSAASHALDLIGALYAIEARAVAEAEGDPDRLLELREVLLRHP